MNTPYIDKDITEMSDKDLIQYEQDLIDYITKFLPDDLELHELLEIVRDLTLREGR